MVMSQLYRHTNKLIITTSTSLASNYKVILMWAVLLQFFFKSLGIFTLVFFQINFKRTACWISLCCIIKCVILVSFWPASSSSVQSELNSFSKLRLKKYSQQVRYYLFIIVTKLKWPQLKWMKQSHSFSSYKYTVIAHIPYFLLLFWGFILFSCYFHVI